MFKVLVCLVYAIVFQYMMLTIFDQHVQNLCIYSKISTVTPFPCSLDEFFCPRTKPNYSSEDKKKKFVLDQKFGLWPKNFVLDQKFCLWPNMLHQREKNSFFVVFGIVYQFFLFYSTYFSELSLALEINIFFYYFVITEFCCFSHLYLSQLNREDNSRWVLDHHLNSALKNSIEA